MAEVWMSRSAIPERFSAATTRSIWRLLAPSASAAVVPWVTTPAEKTARSGTRLLRPSALKLSKALGVLRKELHKEVEKRIVLTINKEMTDRPIPDIEELLVGEAAPPA